MELRKESLGKKPKRASVSKKKSSSARKQKPKTYKSKAQKSRIQKRKQKSIPKKQKRQSIPTISASSSSNLDTITIRFAVRINNDVTQLASENYVANVLQWYNQHIAFYKTYNRDVRQLDITHEYGNIFRLRCVYETARGPIASELEGMVIDPDHDGNSPLILNGTEYLVRGRV